jgi:hypothetical protein
MNTGAIAKIGTAAGVTALVTGGLVAAHERVFLAAQPREQRASRTWLTAGQFIGVGALGTAIGAATSKGTLRAGMIASGAALTASSLLAAAYTTRTARDGQATKPPFGQRLADLVTQLPPLAVRSGETLLAGAIVGGLGGAMKTRTLKGTATTAAAGAVLGAAAGAATFNVIGADR